jgi:hypothetical protein
VGETHVINLSRRSLLGRSLVSSAAALVGLEVGRTTAPTRVAFQACDLPATVQAEHGSLYSATNTSFGTASTGGSYAHCAVVFTAPDTGRVLIHWSGGVRNLDADGSAVAYISPEVRTGGTVGSGTVVLAPSDARTVRTNLGGTHTVRAGATHLLTGLTGGATYNARILHRVTSSTGEFFQRALIVAPTS